MSDVINHPPHYEWSGLQPITVVDAWDLSFCLGNVVKYICRAGCKPGADRLDDLRKAAWYLNHQIEVIERGPCANPDGTEGVPDRPPANR